MTSELTASSRLRELETIIEKGQAEFIAVGQALAEIREKKLYRPEYKTFDVYCQERWGFGASRARQQIRAAQFATQIVSVTTGNTAPQTEREARRLVEGFDKKAFEALPPDMQAVIIEEKRAERESQRELARQRAEAEPEPIRLKQPHRDMLIKISRLLLKAERMLDCLPDEIGGDAMRHVGKARKALPDPNA